MKATLLLLATLVPSFLAGNTCNYDCDAPFATKFGNYNLNAGLAGFPTAWRISWTPLLFKEVCGSSSVTEKYQPQIQAGSPNQIFVLCGERPELTLNKVTVDAKKGELNVSQSITVDVADDVATLEGFTVFPGYIAVNAGKELFVYYAGDLSLAFSVQFGAQLLGSPSFSHGFVHVISGTKIHSVSLSYTGSADVNTVETGVANALGYVLIDGKENYLFCSQSGVVKVSLTGAVSLVNLASGGKKCSSMILSDAGVAMISAVDSNTGATTLFELTNTDFSKGSATTIVKQMSETVYAMTRSSYFLNGEKVAYLVLTTSEGVEVISDVQTTVTERGGLLDVVTTPNLINAPAPLSDQGEPIFVTGNQIGAIQLDGQVKFLAPTQVFTDAEMSKLGEIKYSTAPVLANYNAVVLVTESGKAILYTYCKRWVVGQEKPLDNACPVGDLPDADGLSAALVIVASASTALCLPMSLYLCRKAKFDGKRKDRGMSSN